MLELGMLYLDINGPRFSVLWLWKFQYLQLVVKGFLQ